eukprot:190222-Hanusia_phi.AAC.5
MEEGKTIAEQVRSDAVCRLKRLTMRQGVTGISARLQRGRPRRLEVSCVGLEASQAVHRSLYTKIVNDYRQEFPLELALAQIQSVKRIDQGRVQELSKKFADEVREERAGQFA